MTFLNNLILEMILSIIVGAILFAIPSLISDTLKEIWEIQVWWFKEKFKKINATIARPKSS